MLYLPKKLEIILILGLGRFLYLGTHLLKQYMLVTTRVQTFLWRQHNIMKTWDENRNEGKTRSTLTHVFSDHVKSISMEIVLSFFFFHSYISKWINLVLQFENQSWIWLGQIRLRAGIFILKYRHAQLVAGHMWSPWSFILAFYEISSGKFIIELVFFTRNSQFYVFFSFKIWIFWFLQILFCYPERKV